MKTITIGTFALAAAFTVGGCSSHSKAYNQGYSVGYQVGAEVPGQGSPFYEGQPDQRTIAVYCDSGEQFSENPYGQDPAQSDWYDGWDAGCHDGMVAPEPKGSAFSSANSSPSAQKPPSSQPRVPSPASPTTCDTEYGWVDCMPSGEASPRPSVETFSCDVIGKNEPNKRRGAWLSGAPNISAKVNIQFFINTDTKPIVDEITQTIDMSSSGNYAVWLDNDGSNEINEADINGTVACQATAAG